MKKCYVEPLMEIYALEPERCVLAPTSAMTKYMYLELIFSDGIGANPITSLQDGGTL